MDAFFVLHWPRLSAHSLDERERDSEREQTHISLQSTAESFASVLDQTSTWSNFTREETSTLATVFLESVESTTLAALLKPSTNASQTVRTEYLGGVYPSRQGS